MPIYGYVCKSCEHRFDVLQKMSDEPLVHCPDCGAAALQKELSAPKFRLKGSGWYETDFKKGNQRNLHARDSDGKPSDGKAADGKATDGKAPESKPEAAPTTPGKAAASKAEAT